MEIREISWALALPVRHKVLWPMEALSYSMVEGDEHGQHYGAYIDEQLVCVASIYTERNSARLRKFATLEKYQGQGIGTKILKHIFEELENKHITYFWFDARETAIGFYEHLGFSIEGDRFFKNKVPYVKMSMRL